MLCGSQWLLRSLLGSLRHSCIAHLYQAPIGHNRTTPVLSQWSIFQLTTDAIFSQKNRKQHLPTPWEEIFQNIDRRGSNGPLRTKMCNFDLLERAPPFWYCFRYQSLPNHIKKQSSRDTWCDSITTIVTPVSSAFLLLASVIAGEDRKAFLIIILM